MGVSPMSLKKKRCSRHFRPMDRRAGRRSSSLANLEKREARHNSPARPSRRRRFKGLLQNRPSFARQPPPLAIHVSFLHPIAGFLMLKSAAPAPKPPSSNCVVHLAPVADSRLGPSPGY